MKFYKLLPLLLVLIINGCSSKYVVTFDSAPQGASLVCNGKNWGNTPLQLYYDESVKTQSTINVGDCSANWVSGARESYPSYLTVYPSGGTIVKVERPRGDGYATDANYALQLRQTEATERAASAQNYNQNTNKACKKFGDLSGRVYYFDTAFCPYGYY